MLRLLLLAILIAVLWSSLGRAVLRLRGGGRGAQRPQGPPPRAAITETLVRCQQCGVHVPRSRGLAAARGGGFGVYCSEACRTAAGQAR